MYIIVCARGDILSLPCPVRLVYTMAKATWDWAECHEVVFTPILVGYGWVLQLADSAAQIPRAYSVHVQVARRPHHTDVITPKFREGEKKITFPFILPHYVVGANVKMRDRRHHK